MRKLKMAILDYTQLMPQYIIKEITVSELQLRNITVGKVEKGKQLRYIYAEYSVSDALLKDKLKKAVLEHLYGELNFINKQIEALNELLRSQ